jgi:hypothetical protein
MKKVFLSALILLLAGTNVPAQRFQLGVKAGGNLATVSINGEADGLMSIPGFQAGLTVDYGFKGCLYLLTGLEITQKGFTLETTYEVVSVTATAKPLYLQLPLHIGYKIDLGVVRFVPRLGTYVAYGLGGKITEKASYAGISETESLDYFGGDAVKKLDFGLGLGAGMEWGRLGLTLGYDFGLANIHPARNEASVRNNNLFLTAGYKF